MHGEGCFPTRAIKVVGTGVGSGGEGWGRGEEGGRQFCFLALAPPDVSYELEKAVAQLGAHQVVPRERVVASLLLVREWYK